MEVLDSMAQLERSLGESKPTDWLEAALDVSRQSVTTGITQAGLRFAQLTVEVARQRNLQHHLVVALNNLGNLLFLNDQPYDALNVLNEALLLTEGTPPSHETARTNNLMGAAYLVLGHPEQSYTYFERTLKISRNLQDTLMEAKCLNNMALLLLQKNNYSDALLIMKQAENLYIELENSQELCRLIINRVGIKIDMLSENHNDISIKEIQQDILQAKQILLYNENIYQEIAILQYEATLYCRNGHVEKAKHTALYALKLSEKHQIHDLQAHTHKILGEICNTAENLNEALEHLHVSVQLFRNLNYQENLLHPLELLVKTLKKLGRFEEALHYHEELHQLDQEIRNEAATKQLEMMAFQRKLEQSQHEAELERIRNEELERLVQERTAELESAYLEMLERLAIAAEFRDSDTGEHTVRVGEQAAEVARELGMPEERVHILRLAARLHDVGKIAISDTILHKPGKLTADEFLTMKAHTLAGAKMLSRARSELIRMAEVIALTHHEKWDGSGYPHGLKGEDIPLEGRIVAVVDVLDALTSTRPYKNAWTLQDALLEIEKQAGKHFDPQVVRALLTIYNRQS